jgi:choline monooxygenase
MELECRTVFARSWQMVGRLDQLQNPGQYVTAVIAGEPIVVVRGSDRVLRGFFNVCLHHAAAVMTEPEGTAPSLRCPYHGWTYSLAGELKGAPDFAGVCNFDRAANGLVPVETAVWEQWVFVRLESGTGDAAQDPQAALESFLGPDLINQVRPLGLDQLHWLERRHYTFDCNWKVFVDNYLDGGYHVPHLHKGLDSVLDYSNYMVENGDHFCLQWSPLVSAGAEAATGAVRKGERALYYWLYPNFMINWYEGVMDTNLVLPHGVDKTEVIFDFYFPDVSVTALERNRASIDVGQRIQDEDVGICKSVQGGLNSRAYKAGRLSVRREAGEHLFHRLLYSDLKARVAE